jgi:ubiquinol-cytochrome c reductase cytochrome c1 subunit
MNSSFFKLNSILVSLILIFFSNISFAKEARVDLLKPNWSFDGFFGTFDRASLQRGYQVYKEVCASCHSMKLVSYRNLSQEGGPEFTEEEVKAIASQFEITDGPNADGEMFERPGLPSDRFKSPYLNDNASRASNGGAYPPDMSVLAKARPGGADYIYSVLMGYEEKIPENIKLEEGVYYNKYMSGNKIRMSKPLSEGVIDYTDGTKASEEQMSKDLVSFLVWASEPHLEARKQIGFKSVIYLLILTILVYLIKKKIWLRIEPKV